MWTQTLNEYWAPPSCKNFNILIDDQIADNLITFQSAFAVIQSAC